jgi:hypothetical protein
MHTNADQWVRVNDAYPLLQEIFPSLGALRWHLQHRDENGLVEQDAVRVSPVHRLILNPARVRRWAMAEPVRRNGG